MACGGGCGCGPPDPIQESREKWRVLLFLFAIGGVLVFFAAK
jgi:hypothetical protein